MNIQEERKRLNIEIFKCQNDKVKCIEHYSNLYGNETHFTISKQIDAGLIEPCKHIKEIITILDNEIIKIVKNNRINLEHYWNMCLKDLLILFRYKLISNIETTIYKTEPNKIKDESKNNPTDPLLKNEKYWNKEFENNKGDNQNKWYPEIIKERFTKESNIRQETKEITKTINRNLFTQD